MQTIKYDTKMKLGRKVKRCRYYEVDGMYFSTRSELARFFGVKPQTITMYEKYHNIDVERRMQVTYTYKGYKVTGFR